MTTKLVIFDLDGVLIDSKDLHFDALNRALAGVDARFVISREEHVRLFDGLPTSAKLEILTTKKQLDPKKYKQIWQDKQKHTLAMLDTEVKRDEQLRDYLRQLRDAGCKIAVASNSIRGTITLILKRLGLIEFVDVYMSNEDVMRNKPFPEMYWKCMTEVGALPADTVILEDSHIGRQGALDSKCHLLAIENRNDLDQHKIDLVKHMLSNQQKTQTPWESKKLNVLVPMAGEGSRFREQGYTFPKPLIEVHGKPMIQVVVENLNIKARFIFVVQQSHYEKYNLQFVLPLIAPGCEIIQIKDVTEGAACTTLLAKELINTGDALLIANSDQFIHWNSNETMYAVSNDNSDGCIITFPSTHPKWSYAKIGEDGYVCEVAEKKPISSHATVGIYYWKKGSDYVRYAEQMIAADIRVNGEFYVCPVYNQAIAAGRKIRIKEIDENSMWGIGTPEDLHYFLEHHPA